GTAAGAVMRRPIWAVGTRAKGQPVDTREGLLVVGPMPAGRAATVSPAALIMAATSAIMVLAAAIMAIQPVPIGAAAIGMAATGLGPTTVTDMLGFCRCCRSPTRPTGMAAFRITTPTMCT